MRHKQLFKINENISVEHSLYWIGLWLTLMVLTLYWIAAQLADIFPVIKLLTVCQLKEIANMPCPSCGGTRACIYFFKGQWLKSLYYNAFGFYFAFVYSLFYITQTLQRLSKGKIKGLKWRDCFWKIGLFILAVQYLLKLFVPYFMI